MQTNLPNSKVSLTTVIARWLAAGRAAAFLGFAGNALFAAFPPQGDDPTASQAALPIPVHPIFRSLMDVDPAGGVAVVESAASGDLSAAQAGSRTPTTAAPSSDF